MSISYVLGLWLNILYVSRFIISFVKVEIFVILVRKLRLEKFFNIEIFLGSMGFGFWFRFLFYC